MSSTGHFDAIIADLEEQAKQLNAEEEQCEADRQKNTKITKEQSQKIDDQTGYIDRKNEFIADLNKKIADANEEIEDLNTELAEAREQRALEKTAYDGNKAADESAVGLIEQTMPVLNKFYEDNGLALFQAPGEAPPPPPQTGSEPYGGARGESNGIQGILGLIKEDVEKGIKVATSEEEDAIKEFETLESESASTLSLLHDQGRRGAGHHRDREPAPGHEEHPRRHHRLPEGHRPGLRLHLSELRDPEVESLGGARRPRESEGDPLGRRGHGVWQQQLSPEVEEGVLSQ